tara:strand:- start:666 stop:1457 length:792 start_codon:yes stop_codon:yes gene_type:complete
MEEKKPFKIVSAKRSRYILPNVITLIGVCLGISSIKFSLDQNYSIAIIFLLAAALLDGLDGRIARLIDGTSEFGKELDSLTDFVSFGIAPALIIYFWELNKYGKIGWAIVLIFSICCVLRLARFNLTQVKKNEQWRVNFFEGVPSPAGAILVLLPLIYEISNFELPFSIDRFIPFYVIFIAVLLISKVPTLSFKKITIPRKLTIFLLLSTGVIFFSLILYTFETLFILGLVYLLLIPIGVIIFQKKSKNINQTLPEDDDEDIL